MTDYICVYDPNTFLPCGIGTTGRCPLGKTTTTDRYICEFCHEQENGRRAPCKPDGGKTLAEVMLERTIKQIGVELDKLKNMIKELYRLQYEANSKIFALEKCTTFCPVNTKEKCCWTCIGCIRLPQTFSMGDGINCSCWKEKK